MRKSFTCASRNLAGRTSFAKELGYGSSLPQGTQRIVLSIGLVNRSVRQGSSTSGWDVGNPPTEEKHPGDAHSEEGEKKVPDARREQVDTPNLHKEKSTREFFHEKAREVEERLSKERSEGKDPRE
ncbi:hypothetical protein KP509_05G074300 [Ceratopteris richardii]|uniref:Uncharacterized protein n=1 Tax=Ceratopteris richardii TaxID=49495 RepID=A0A8T2URU8_CERRI|nr:hypothetical protein KP509_05G074300 [Ceratopteris richardii]